MTLDNAQDRFRQDCSVANALIYLAIAVEYYNDNMIGRDTVADVGIEIGNVIGQRVLNSGGRA